MNFGGIEQKACMLRIRNFAEIALNLPFTEYDFYKEYRGTFEKTDLGRMKMTEILYIFLGIHTANAVELSGRLTALQPAAD